jgi:hypothetical protein
MRDRWDQIMLDLLNHGGHSGIEKPPSRMDCRCVELCSLRDQLKGKEKIQIWRKLLVSIKQVAEPF